MICKKQNCPKCGREIDVWFFEDNDPISQIANKLAKNIQCNDCGKKREEELNRRRDESIISDLLENSGIPEKRRDWNPELGNQELLNFIFENSDKSIFIADNYGSGKTWAVCMAGVKKIQGRAVSVKFYRAVDVCNELSRLYSSGMEYAERFVRSLCKVRVLILDDLGKEKLTERGGELLYRVIDERYVNAMATWITTNYSGKELEQHLGEDYGPAIMRRLRDMCVSWQEYKHSNQLNYKE